MATNRKNCPPAPKKQMPEKPATPPPPPVPVFAKVPCERDQQAYGLYLEGHSQRWIADKLKCAQPTVLRGIRRMEEWLAKTLPEDRGEYTATEKLRLALAKHERLMERLLKMSLREFRRSRRTIPMKKTITMKDGVDEKGEPVKIRIEEWNKPQIGRKGFIDSAAKASHEITVLAAGWLGPGCGSISMAEVMDPEERDRWDRIVTTRDAQIKELQDSVTELKSRPLAPREESAAGSPDPVSKVAEKEPAVNQQTSDQCVTTSSRQTVCAAPTDSSPPEMSTCKTCIKSPPKVGAGRRAPPSRLTEGLPGAGGGDLRSGVPAGSVTRAEQSAEPTDKLAACPTQPLCRWSDEHRQEALDLHCRLHRLPRAKLSQASGIPDPKNMTPREYVERGRPYCISIDRSEEEARCWRLGQQRFDEIQAEMLRDT